MGAAHIVGHDLQFGLGVNPGLTGEQQVAAELGGIGALRNPRHLDRTVEDGVGLARGQAFLQLVQLTLGTVKPHRGMGGQLLISAGDRQALERGFRLTIHLHHPRLDAPQGPSRHHGREGVVTACFLLHSEVGQQGGPAVCAGQKTVTQHGFLPEMSLQHVAMGRGTFRQDDLQQLQLRFFLQQQQHPRGDQPLAPRQHQFQGGNLAADPQGQQLMTAGVVELNRPGLSTSAAIQGVTQGLLKLGGTQERDALWTDLILQGRPAAIEHQTHHSLRSWWEGARGRLPTGRKFGQCRQTLEIGEPPGFLASGGEAQTLQGRPTPLLHRCQHTAGHGQATP